MASARIAATNISHRVLNSFFRPASTFQRFNDCIRSIPISLTAASRLFRPCRSSQSLHCISLAPARLDPYPCGFSGHVARPSRSIQPFNSSTRYSSLLGQCLRLVAYATGTLPHLRLRAFHRRSSLPSLCYCIASNCVAALYCETPAANDHHGRGGVKRSRLLHLLSLTKTR
jgi:hypothetical protein